MGETYCKIASTELSPTCGLNRAFSKLMGDRDQPLLTSATPPVTKRMQDLSKYFGIKFSRISEELADTSLG